LSGSASLRYRSPDDAVRELDYVINELKLKGVEILTNVNGQELSDPKFRPFFAKAEQLGAFIMMHPNGFTHGERLTHFYFNNVLGNPLDTTLALHNLIFSGTLARFPDLKLMAVHGGGYLPGYSGRIDHAWGARQGAHGDLPLPPTTYLRQVYLDTVVFTYHPIGISDRRVRSGPDRDGHRLPVRYGRIQSDRAYCGGTRNGRSNLGPDRRRKRGESARP
jgi:aminocarboxymuconate-semialdehyde decarboxylase